MSDLKKLSLHSLLTQAASADFSKIQFDAKPNSDTALQPLIKSVLIEAEKNNFNAAEAEYFLSHYRIVDQRTNQTNGFSGTLFQEKATGKYFAAFRNARPHEWQENIAFVGLATTETTLAIGWLKQCVTPMDENFSQHIYQLKDEKIYAATENAKPPSITLNCGIPPAYKTTPNKA